MNQEILEFIKCICNQKSLSTDKIFEILESSLSISIKKNFSHFMDFRIIINRKNGYLNTFHRFMIVSEVTQSDRQVMFQTFKLKSKKIILNDFIYYRIPSIFLNNIDIKKARKIIVNKVQESQQLMLLDKFYNCIGQIIIGIVKKVKKNYLILSIREHVEAVMYQSDFLPTEYNQIGDQVKGVLCSVCPQVNGVKLSLSRSNSFMLRALLYLEVPEIREGLIKIKSISRIPGYRSKVAIQSNDNYIDPIGSCIGIDGNRVRSISRELKGECIDIVLWDDNLSRFLMNAISPADVYNVVLSKDDNIIDIFVDFENMSRLVGRYSQNIFLVAQLLGYSLNIITINDSDKNKKLIYHFDNIFIKIFHLKRIVINSLMKLGYYSLNDLTYLSYFDLLKIPGIDKKKAYLIRKTVNNFLKNLLYKTQ